jgi:hypothetical protein
MPDLLSIRDLPDGFSYPKAFIRVVELGLTNLEPWLILEGELLHERTNGLRKRYAARTLVPFAMRGDNDDIACWDIDRQGAVVIVHDFADPGWEQRAEFKQFYDWLRQAVEDLIDFDD